MLESIESTPTGSMWIFKHFKAKVEYMPEEVDIHYNILKNAGFINADGKSYLTWSGYEILESIRRKEEKSPE